MRRSGVAAPPAENWLGDRDCAPLDCGVWVPRRVAAPRGTLIAVHGISRDVGEQAGGWREFTEALGLTLVVPRFTRERFPTYQRLGASRTGTAVRADEALLQGLRWLEVKGWPLPRPWILFGHSGGAQFAHRFALMHPTALAAVVVSSAGWYTFPESGAAFPLGLRLGPGWLGGCHLRGWLGLPTLVTVGTRDRRRDASLRRDQAIDARQGRDRLTRARRWVEALNAAARDGGWVSRIELRELSRAGHAFRECMRAGLPEETARFLGESAILGTADARESVLSTGVREP